MYGTFVPIKTDNVGHPHFKELSMAVVDNAAPLPPSHKHEQMNDVYAPATVRYLDDP
jgi:hypothetical protein